MIFTATAILIPDPDLGPDVLPAGPVTFTLIPEPDPIHHPDPDPRQLTLTFTCDPALAITLTLIPDS